MSGTSSIVRIDLHCHSNASDRPPLWFMQRLGCPESFTPPEVVRENAMARGMDFVTLTDHDTIKGVRQIERMDNVIRGVEVTTQFPDGVKVHVVCLGLTDEQFETIEHVRQDIVRFAHYLNEEGIVHFCAHPLHKVNGRTAWDHFEVLLLLFKHLEILNGTRLNRLNQSVENVAKNLTPLVIKELSLRHSIMPLGDRPWEKIFVGGSDDHSGLFVGSCYTEVEVEEVSKEAVLEGIRLGRTKVIGETDGCLTLAHQVNSIAYQYMNKKVGSESQEFFGVLGRIFERKPKGKERRQFRKGIKDIVNHFWKPKGTGVNLYEEVKEVMRNNQSLKALFQEGIMTREEFNRNVFHLASDVLDEMILQVCKKPKFIPYFSMFSPLLFSSYIMTTKNLHDEKDLIVKADEWLGVERTSKALWFTDSFVNMDGVSKTCKVFLESARKRGNDLTMLTSAEDELEGVDGLVNFKPVKSFSLPGYDKVKLHLPSFLKVLKFVEDGDFDSIVISTPGPVGLMGLMLGRLMRIPVHGIYHTDLPRIALQVSGDPMFGELALALTRLFYNQVDRVFVPSKWYIDDMVQMGIEPKRIKILERWVDMNLFKPANREPDYWKSDKPVKLLYVGRISKDKNLDLLLKAYKALSEKKDNFVLHVVGDGPYFDEMKEKTKKLKRFVMTGAKFGKDLAKAFASSDVFVYPGLLDTFGNVVVEAQASGLPCVVMNAGGPQQLIEHGKTGFISNSEQEFIRNVGCFLENSLNLRWMSEQAVAHCSRRFNEDQIFNTFWDEITSKEYITDPQPNRFFEPQHQYQTVIPLYA